MATADDDDICRCREIDDLAAAHEATSCFAGSLVGFGDPRPSVTAQSLLNDSQRKRIRDRFCQRFKIFDERAVHSIWMKWYLNAVLPPVLLADTLLNRSLPIRLPEVRFVIADDARIAAIAISNESTNTSGIDAFTRLSPLIFDHFAPLINILCARTDVTSRVYWSNVGNTYEAMLRRIESIAGTSLRLTQAQQLLEIPFWPDGRPNPLASAVHYENGIRLRRICCLQYLLPDRRFCRACPIDEAQAFHQQTRATC